MTEDDASIVSQQSLRVLRASLQNSSRFSDDELMHAAMIIGSLYNFTADVPTFIGGKEQLSFFTNMLACFILPTMISSGFINPKAAGQYITESSSQQNEPAQVETDVKATLN